MRRPLAWALIVGVGSLLGLAVAGVPDRSEDPPLRLAAEQAPPTTRPPVTTTTTTAPPRPPAEVTVMAVNASASPGRANAVTQEVAAAGYATVTPGPSPAAQPTTAVHWTEGWEREARALAAALAVAEGAVSPLPDPSPVRDLQGAVVVVVVGRDRAE